MSERLLISDSGQLFENKYFDTITTKKIKKVFPSQNILLGNNVFSKVLTLLKVNGLEFLKISIHNTRDRTFVFINKLNCTYNKKGGINIVKNAPVAFFLYEYNFEKKEKILIEESIY